MLFQGSVPTCTTSLLLPRLGFSMRFRLLCLCSLLLASAGHSQAVPTWRLQLDHAIRPAEGSPGAIGNILGVAVTRGGEVYVAEQKPARVTRFDAAGKFVRTVIAQGAGPREAQRAQIVLQGDTLVVHDPQLARLTRIGPDNRLLDERLFKLNAVGFPGWATADGTLIFESPRSGIGYNAAAVRVLPNGRLDSLTWFHDLKNDRFMRWESRDWVIQGAPFSPAGRATFDQSGRLVLGATGRSRWVVLSGKDTVQTISLPDRAVSIVPAVRDSVWKAWRAKLPAKLADPGNVLTIAKIPTTLPPWLTIDVSPAGEWWVGRPGPNGALGSWDVIVGGRVAGHVPVPPRILPPRLEMRPWSFGGSFVAIVHEDEDDLPWIGVYRVVRGR